MGLYMYLDQRLRIAIEDTARAAWFQGQASPPLASTLETDSPASILPAQLLITDDWLRESGFKRHQFDRQPGKQWLLWLDMACVEATGPKAFGEDLGLELTRGDTPSDERGPWYFCWLRADTSRRYSRFLHVRHLRWQHELIAMVEGLTGAKWAPADCFNGAMFSPESAARRRAENDRLDRRIIRESPPWREIEQDDSRGGALPEHMEAAVKRGGAK